MGNQSDLGQAQDSEPEWNVGKLEPDLLAREGGWVAKHSSCRTQLSEWDKVC